MATTNLPASAGHVTPTPAQLSAAREALVARIDAAATRADTRGLLPGMPANLISASCYLVEHGVVAPTSAGEFFFNWDSTTSRQFLDGLTAGQRAQEIEEGRAALFDGRRAICPSVMDATANLVTAGRELAQATVEADATADALRARWNANAARRAAPALDREAA